jgi:hypothetical protein
VNAYHELFELLITERADPELVAGCFRRLAGLYAARERHAEADDVMRLASRAEGGA